MAVSLQDKELALRLMANALEFDGEDDTAISANALSTVTTAVTAEAWILPYQATGKGSAGVAEAVSSDRTTSDQGFILRTSNANTGKPIAYIRTDAAAWRYASAPQVLPVGKWTHLAMTWDDATDTLILYVDGVAVDTQVYSGESMVDPDSKVTIGFRKTSGGSSGYFWGLIREVAVFKDARTAAEILSDMEGLVGTEPDLVDLWHMAEGSGTSLADSAGGDNGATASGAAWVTSSGPLWTAVTADVYGGSPVHWTHGTKGHSVLDRVASIGTMDFLLKNGEDNSGAKVGYYTFGHANCRAGFQIGLDVRLRAKYGDTWYPLWTGRIQAADPAPGAKGRRLVGCRAVDWMQEAADHRLNLVPVQADQRTDQVIQTVLDNMRRQPSGILFDQGLETFTYAPDNCEDERTAANMVLQACALSEFGYIFLRNDGVLEFQNRHHRVKDTTVVATIANPRNVRVTSDEDQILNHVEATVYPRDLGTTDEILATLEGWLEIRADETQEFEMRYVDPSNPDVRLSALTTLDPEGANECPNRDFETDASGWSAASDAGTATVAQSSEAAKRGLYSLKLTAPSGAGTYVAAITDQYTGYVQNDVVFAQAYVNIPVAWPAGVVWKLVIQEMDSGGGWLANNTAASVTPPTSGWVRLCGKVTLGNASTAKIRLAIQAEGSATFAGEYGYIDEVFVCDEDDLNFEFSTSESGGGAMDCDLELLDSEMGGNTARWVMTNKAATSGFITVLKPRGKALRTYAPLTRTAKDEASIRKYGRRLVRIPLLFQDDPSKGQDWADITLSWCKDPLNILDSVDVVGNNSSTEMNACLQVNPGDRVHIEEAVTGVDGDYFVNGIEGWLQGGERLMVRWSTAMAAANGYWVIGTSKLGTETIVGF